METETIDAGGGDDVVIGAEGVLELDGAGGDDTMYANGAAETTGGADDDLIYGDAVPELGTDAAEPLEKALMPFVDELGVEAVEEAVQQAGAELASSSGGGAGQPVFADYTVVAVDPIEGDGGPDNLWGGSGNDTIYGYGGNDRLFGNIGDDTLWGGTDDDLLSGGQGGDDLDGNNGDDMLRGDGTVDRILDSGSGEDTLSFAGGVTPGFNRNVPGPAGAPNGYDNFPGENGERGAYVDLGNKIADNGEAEDGGGKDDGSSPYLTGIENIIGTPYADYIVGNDGANVIDGGGGSDVILGEGGADTIYGNAGNDNLRGDTGVDIVNGGPGDDFCQGETEWVCDESGTASDAVIARDDSKVAVGMMARPGVDHKDFYLTGSTGSDNVDITYTQGNPDTIRFELSSASFDTSSAEKTDNCNYANANGTPKRVLCESYDRIGTIAIAGMAGNDDLFGPYSNMPRATTYIALGGTDNDWLKGTNTSDDLLVDGGGRDILLGYGRDDGLINKAGADEIWLGEGDDLALTVRLCESEWVGGVWTGDEITGGSGEDNASWAKLPDSYSGVGARLTTGTFGNKSSNGPTCSGNNKVGELNQIESLEGSEMDDGLIGDNQDNNLLGRPGQDTLNANGGKDYINARDGENDSIDCGGGTDSAKADPLPKDPTSNCDGNVTRG